jgi:hypothetical protein
MLRADSIASCDNEDSQALLRAPWEDDPYSLLSWWDMEKFSAAAFYGICRQLQELRNSIERDIQAMVASEWNEATRLFVQAILMEVERSCDELELAISAKAAQHAATICLGQGTEHGRFVAAVEHLELTINWEMEDRLFFHVPTDRAKFYDQGELFGQEVNTKFPSLQYDIVEAGSCYATGRSTACVFHLMRVMEVGVQEFGIRLGITFADKKDWHNIIEEAQKAIKLLPQKDASTVLLSQAASHLYSVKVGWRNRVMHPHDKYTLDEAKDLIAQVRLFMQQLAKIV